MSKEKELLNTVYQSSKMGVESINNIISKVDNGQIRDCMLKDKNSFDEIANSAADMIFSAGEKPEEKSVFSKLGAEIGAKMSIMNDNSTTKVAEMMMQGASCGIVEVTRAVKCAPSAKPEVKQIADNLIGLQERIFQDYKQFL